MKFRNIFLSIIPIILFNACGSSSTSSDATEEVATSSFTVVDPYIKNATFFWDKNKDGIKDADEPLSTLSDENGKFDFNTTIAVGERIVMQDKGEHNGLSYTGQLSAIVSSSGVVTPLTTLEDLYPQLDIRARLNELGVSIADDDIHKDPMANKSDNLIISTLAIDNFLKITNFKNVTKDENTLSDIISVVKSLLNYDTSDTNIEDTVSILDYITSKVQIDGTLDELQKFKTDSSYREKAQNALKNRADKTKPGKIDFIDEDFSSEVAKKNSRALDNISLTYSKIPTKDQETTLTIDLGSVSSGNSITWSIKEQPTGANMELSVFNSDKSASFTPTVAGAYKISVAIADADSSSSKLIPFTVKENYAYNINKVEGMSAETNTSTLLGAIQNQSWIYSKTLDESELSTVISKYSSFTKVGYDETSGMLVEYDNETSQALEDLESLKLEQGVNDVFNRVYIGENAFQETAIYPIDNGNFNDGGTNWHLETINMPEAWEYTTGSSDFMVGVCDGGFDNKNSDMSGRFASFLTTRTSDHGMGVAGAIAANSDNGIGISGINWSSNVVASYMNDYGAVENTINTKINEKVVKLINNSWGYHLSSDFNPTNAAMATQRFNDLQNWLAPFRHLVEVKPDKLFLWAAGNGVGNGASNTGYYGVDAKYDNGNLHYKNGVLNKLDNLLVVAAFHSTDKILRYYSEYGTSVDIASPTEFNSLALNNGTYPSFGGTSAATPVTTAVASLIMSINPNLTPAQVKDILINSATEFITRRQTNPYSPSTTEALTHPIPILNAKEALKMAYETVSTPTNTVIDYTAFISDNITPKITFRYFTDDNDYKVVGISSNLASSSDGATYSALSSKSVNSDVLEMSLDTAKRYHRMASTLTLKHIITGETKTEDHIKEFNYSDLTIRSVDISTSITNPTIVPYADFNLSYSTILENYLISSQTASNGLKKLYLPYTFYKVIGSKTGYKDSAIENYTSEAKSYNIDLPFGLDDGIESGYISGIVLDEDGSPLENAEVSISDDSVLITTVTTNSSGYYMLSNINKNNGSGNPITNFKMTASLDGYNSTMKQNVIVLDGKNRTENFTLISVPDNQPPLANAGDDQSIVFGDITIIGADGSLDYDGYIKSYIWKEGTTQLSNKHTFIATNLSLGTHEIILTVTDDDGATNSDMVTIIVNGELSYYWDEGTWSDCSGECGSNNGTQTRTVVCKSNAGSTVADTLCTTTKPSVTQSCTASECPFDYETITSAVTGKVWLDRNLGATKACDQSLDDFNTTAEYIASQEECFGDYYQWGRDNDGHEDVNSGTTYTLSLNTTPTHNSFILSTSTYNYDWSTIDTNGSTRSTFWSLNDGTAICPSGFRVPTIEELQAEEIANIADGYNKLKLPVSGFRNTISSGTLSSQATNGLLWSSSMKYIDGKYEAFNFNYFDTYVSYGIGKRANGFPVRCIEDYTDIVENIAPTANAGIDQSLTLGEAIYVNGALSSDSDGTIVSYEWKEGTTILSTKKYDSLATLTVGIHTITLTVTDDDGATGTDTMVITIAEPETTYYWNTGSWGICIGECGTNNGTQTRTVTCKASDGSTVSDGLCTTTKPSTIQMCTASECGVGNIAPVARAGVDQTVELGNTVYVYGSSSSDSDGIIVSYVWKEGTTTLLSSVTGNLPTLSVGIHTITLTVTDDDGAIGTDTVDITITDAPAEVVYYWDIGSWGVCAGACGTDNATQSRTVVCKASADGSTVDDGSCTTTKPDTTKSCTASICIVDNVPPVANAGVDQTVTLGEPVFINGLASSDSDGYIVSYEWNEGTTTLSNNWFDAIDTLAVGAHTVTLTVADDDGATDTDDVIITIAAPTTYYWLSSAWSDCSGDCGTDNGTQSRTVVCKSTTGSTVSDTLCTATKPVLTQVCTASECETDDSIIISPVTGRTWLSKNLGSDTVCTAFDDEDCYGDYYQWGRDTDGHEKYNSGTTAAISTTITPADDNFIISDSSNHYDWSSEDSDGLSRAVFWAKTDATSVCPGGFRVPTIDELLSEDIQSLNDAYSKLKLPVAGVRNYNGSMTGKNILGGVWSTNSNGDYSNYLFYDGDTADWNYHSRAVGRSVRCIKEE